ncbi:MAG: glycosyltransferase family 39 protein [Alphaproteobacteria bacterium]|nr:glycosyltransferase family 39 protein [Alphaproteobacteria bacterium]
MSAILPLSADEAYYLLWSHHLQAGYFDHPPAIAFLIRAGTLIFGDTPLGVRAIGLPLSLLATWFVWQTAVLLLKDQGKAVLAAIIFNFALMTNVELLVATPDMPSIVTVAAFLWCLAKMQTTNDGTWWLAAGAAAGLSLLSKYSMLFVGLGTAVWLLADARGRAWLKTPWPWAGGVLAPAIFSPNLVWQSQHGWETFVFQFGRAAHGALTWRYLAEFIGAQLGLVTPLILLLAALGWWQARRPGNDLFALFVIVGVALLYFLQHALHDRVQGNWPCFLMPALAVLAADAFARVPRWLSLPALPLAGAMLLALYLQAALGLIALKRDPVARLLARDFPAAAQSLLQSAPGGVILTTDYETTALLRYWQPQLKVVQVNEPWRYDWAPAPPAAWFKGQVVYFVETRRDQSDLVAGLFNEMTDAIAHPGGYQSAMVEGAKQVSFGKAP